MDAMEWLEQHRGIDCETAARLGVKGNTGKNGAVVGFPYVNHRTGEVLGHKVRAIGDKRFWFQPSGASRDLFNVMALYEQTGPICITEGEIDVLSLVQAGKARSVSMPDGWTEGLTDQDTPKLKPIFDNLEAFRGQEVIIAGDNDPVGRSMARAIWNALDGVAKSVRLVAWPEGCKDANDCLLQHGVSTVVRCVDCAPPMSPPGIEVSGLHDLPPMPDRVIYAPHDPAYDDVLRLELGSITTITGVPNHGKSTAAVAMLHSLAVANNIRVGTCMFETHPAQLRNQLHRLETGKPFNIDSPASQAVAARASRHWAVVHPQEDDGVAFDMAWVRSTIRTLALHHDCKVVMFDPWNELEHSERPGETETRYIREALIHLRRWAKQYDVAVVVVVHPRKMPPDTPPAGYDIAGSSTWYDKTHMGLTVWKERDQETGEEWTDLIAWKVKDREGMGIQPNTSRVKFNPETGGFRHVVDHYQDTTV